MIDPKNVYSFRKSISKLYNNPNLSLDLIDLVADKVLQISSKSKKDRLIVSEQYNISNYEISITLSEDSSTSDISNIIIGVGESIREFVINNISNISIDDSMKDQFNEFVDKKLIFEVFVIGKVVKFQL